MLSIRSTSQVCRVLLLSCSCELILLLLREFCRDQFIALVHEFLQALLWLEEVLLEQVELLIGRRRLQEWSEVAHVVPLSRGQRDRYWILGRVA